MGYGWRRQHPPFYSVMTLGNQAVRELVKCLSMLSLAIDQTCSRPLHLSAYPAKSQVLRRILGVSISFPSCLLYYLFLSACSVLFAYLFSFTVILSIMLLLLVLLVSPEHCFSFSFFLVSGNLFQLTFLHANLIL